MTQQPPIYGIFQFFSNPQVTSMTVLSIAKISILFALALYIVFALVVIRQVSLMSRTVSTPIDPIIKLFSYLHFFASLAVWYLAFVLL